MSRKKFGGDFSLRQIRYNGSKRAYYPRVFINCAHRDKDTLKQMMASGGAIIDAQHIKNWVVIVAKSLREIKENKNQDAGGDNTKKTTSLVHTSTPTLSKNINRFMNIQRGA